MDKSIRKRAKGRGRILGAGVRYRRGDISIDDSFARFGAKIYAIDTIDSVDVRSEMKGGTLWLWLACLAALFLFLGARALASSVGDGIQWLAIGVALAACAYFSRRRAQKLRWILFLTTSNAEAQAMQSEDRDEVLTLRTTIEAAIMTRRQAEANRSA